MYKYDKVIVCYFILGISLITSIVLSVFAYRIPSQISENIHANIIFYIMIVFMIFSVTLGLSIIILLAIYINPQSTSRCETCSLNVSIEESKIKPDEADTLEKRRTYFIKNNKISTFTFVSDTNLEYKSLKEKIKEINLYLRNSYFKTYKINPALKRNYRINIFCVNTFCENETVKMVVSRLNSDSSIQKKNLNIVYLEQEKKLIFKKIDLLGKFYRVNLIFSYFRCIRILSRTLNISYSSLVDEILK